MKRSFFSALPLLFLLLVAGASSQPPKATIDESDVLTRHLLRRITDLSTEIAKSENKCLEEENAMLRGKRVHHTVNADQGMDLQVQHMLDAEAAIEEHNRKFPDAQWADIKDLLQQFCGDCKDARVLRDAELAAEAKQ